MPILKCPRKKCQETLFVNIYEPGTWEITCPVCDHRFRIKLPVHDKNPDLKKVYDILLTKFNQLNEPEPEGDSTAWELQSASYLVS